MLVSLRLLRMPLIVQSTHFSATSGGKKTIFFSNFEVEKKLVHLRKRELDEKKIECNCERCSDGTEAGTG